MKKMLVAAAVAAVMAAAGSASAANLITNGGFVAADGTPAFSFVTVSGVNAIPGWTVSPGDVDWINTYWESADGDGYSVDINGNNPGVIFQDLATVSGKTYTLTFSMSGNPDAFNPGTRYLDIYVDGSLLDTASYEVGTNTRGDMQWATKTFTFKAGAGPTTLSFASGNGGVNCCYGAALDNVSLTGVPEPATWALMIGGFGGAGAMIRRRRAAAIAA